jgi:FAD/FMN-containing dehydrogenase
MTQITGTDQLLTGWGKMYPDLAGWRAVRAKFDPTGVFRSDLGRRVGLC